MKLLKVAGLNDENQEEFSHLETPDRGRSIQDSVTSDNPNSVDSNRWSAEAVDKVGNQMRIVQEQFFCPVISTITFDYMDDAIRMATDTTYGLVALVFTASSSKGRKPASVLSSGAVWPDCFDAGDMTVPHGGYAESGNGRDRSLHSLEKYSELKTARVQLDKIARGSVE